MKQSDENDSRFECDVDCPNCDSDPTKLRGWASLDGLDRMEVESIAELSVEEFRQLEKYSEGGINGECRSCARAVTTPAPSSAPHLAELGGSSPSMPYVPR